MLFHIESMLMAHLSEGVPSTTGTLNGSIPAVRLPEVKHSSFLAKLGGSKAVVSRFVDFQAWDYLEVRIGPILSAICSVCPMAAPSLPKKNKNTNIKAKHPGTPKAMHP